MDVVTAFAGIGAIILIGFIGTMIFDKIKVPDVILLFFIGILIGPLFKYLFDYEIVSSSTLAIFAPYLAAVALIIILFDAGLDLKFDKLLSHMGVATFHTIAIFCGSLGAVAVLTHYLLGFPWAVGLLLGAVLGGVSSALVIPMLAGMHVTEETKTVLTLESVLTDVLCIVSAITVIGILSGIPVEVGGIAGQLLTPFAVAGMIGLLFGAFWLFFLKKIEGKKFAFMSTLGALFVLYAAVEYVHASGAIAALVFGIMLSNKDEVARILKIKTRLVFDDNIKLFHSEISFVVRTFFFVFLGMSFTLTLSGQHFSPLVAVPSFLVSHPLILFITVLLLILAAFVAVRFAISYATGALDEKVRPNRSTLALMLPRGLAAAVLSQLPFTMPEFQDTSSVYYQTMAPYQSHFVNFAFLIIISTVLISTVGVYATEKKTARRAVDEEEEKKLKIQKQWMDKSKTYAMHVKRNGPLPSKAVSEKPAPAQGRPISQPKPQPAKPAVSRPAEPVKAPEPRRQGLNTVVITPPLRAAQQVPPKKRLPDKK